MHNVAEFYKLIYVTEKQIPKRDRFGIFMRIENTCLVLFENIISAAISQKQDKIQFVKNSQKQIEIIKRLIRITYELGIIKDKNYFKISEEAVEISKMINGWIKYLEKPL